MMRALLVGLIAATVTYFGGMATASSQPNNSAQPQLRALPRPDLTPIPSRIEHGVVSVRNIGTATSAASKITVYCHQVGQRGGCVDVPAALLAAYADPAFPGLVTVQVPAILPGHVYNHTLTFWDDIVWPTGHYQFEFVADAGASNAESNEGNNAGSHVWNKP